MSPEIMSKIEDLVNEIIWSSTKAHAKQALIGLEAILFKETPNLGRHESQLLKSLISYSKNASGRVKEKELWVTNTKDTLTQLKLKVSKGLD